MKRLLRIPLGLLSCGCLLAAGCKQETRPLDPALNRFVQAKAAQAQALVNMQKLDMPSEAWALFDSILQDDYPTATNLFTKLEAVRQGTAPTNPLEAAAEWSKTKLEELHLYSRNTPALGTESWHVLTEAYWAYWLTKHWDKPHLEMAVQGIIEAVPSGAIFFGGTDVGRFGVATAMYSHPDGNPFFAMTQVQLVDGSYLSYLASNLGAKLNLPTWADLSQTYTTYLADAKRRAAAGGLKPGEGLSSAGGNVSVTGAVAVAEMNARLVRWIFEQNPDREIFIEQAPKWPVEWIYPRLIPHGPVFRISRQPLARMDENVLQADRAFWDRWCGRLIGVEIKPHAPVAQVCEVIERIYVRGDLKDFRGDATYLRDIYARNYFGWLRHMSAALYQWRCIESNDAVEKQRMLDESILAYEQAFALDPSVAMDFADLLVQVNRSSDALRVLETSLHSNSSTETKAMIERIQAKARD